MRKDKPSRTAYKVALNVVTARAKPGMDRNLPPGTVQATEKLLVASGATGARTVIPAGADGRLHVKISGNWRVAFKVIDGDVFNVDYEDYH